MIHDNFGITVRLPDVPVHRHQGSDVEAPAWSPIIAPFDGYASASRSELGGLEVRVRGDAGYVYNAHLIGYERLGYVEQGDVVGYVGSTGDATGPHDHFEWHPWNQVATESLPLAGRRLRQELTRATSGPGRAAGGTLEVGRNSAWRAARTPRTTPSMPAPASRRLPR